MKILVTGVNGQLGYDVFLEATIRHHEVIGTGSKDESVFADYFKVDLTDEKDTIDSILSIKPDVIIHCAAWTNVNTAEEDYNHEKVRDINVNATTYIALAAKILNIKMVYISTDYVFGGEGTRPWKPDDTNFNPLNYYGKTKLDGELAVKRIVDKYFIVRTSWLFGYNGNNFVNTIIHLGATNDKLNVIDDQIGSVTYTVDLAKVILDMIETDKYGTYHVTNFGEYISWFDFAKTIFLMVGNHHVDLRAIRSIEYPSSVKRPLNSRLNKDKLLTEGFDRLPHWKDALKRYLHEMKMIN